MPFCDIADPDRVSSVPPVSPKAKVFTKMLTKTEIPRGRTFEVPKNKEPLWRLQGELSGSRKR